jgi:hypothetical protein
MPIGFGDHNGLYGGAEGEWGIWREMFREILNEYWQNDIVTVIAAGNEGEERSKDISQDVPACLGTPDNPLITVGAADFQGTRYFMTTRDIAGKDGDITIWAQGDLRTLCAARGNSGFQLRDQSSVAAPQVAGLAAYFMSLPITDLNWNLQPAPPGTPDPLAIPQNPAMVHPDLHQTGTVSKAVKDYLFRISYPRIPGGVNIAYNDAEEGQCTMSPWDDVVYNRKKKRAQDKCIQRENETFGLTPILARELHQRDSSALVSQAQPQNFST